MTNNRVDIEMTPAGPVWADGCFDAQFEEKV
ncbi:hypothetical protein EaACW_1747 [Erwinia amylovora ACW56400]|uniref:Uncharacterized protein n=1 Tax=Erwinia amylovora NBRC 12687 = CFBP 1232 TaxID=1219359 RepID=A0A831A2I2_ERWAM|nr:hypothetical protein EaACW_1747 [Erwinia amylovora ACW56400]CCO78596.1 hypothetical protein BN432_1798 [Erwinia amylovora Ea356]CCO82390.1 hypothetical protein BN433_1820 [Erwinia amylovora Ea266]CCO86176.1 hypothetical protein BN434_1788 [Erwinia amylovora CFBP 2585]CCO93722.1 hypothetical protein BN437_1792 [Erwinia amylovora NBRC 12687 = CFBP 1232]CCO99073.1 hypothetical protein BN438_1791 [Erwinia amylovora UPN527]